MDGYELGAKDYGKVEQSFDWISFLKRPLVIVKMTNVLFSIIVFGCISSQGWHYVESSNVNGTMTPAEELCIINGSNSTCSFATGLGVISFLASLGLLYLEITLEHISPGKIRRHFIKADFCFSGLLSFLFFSSFCNLAHKWKISPEPAGWYGHHNVDGAIFFSFLSIFTWGMASLLGWRRYQVTPNAFQGSMEAGSIGGYQSFE